MRPRAMRRLLLSLLGLAVLGGAITAAVAATSSPAKPGLTLQIAPASQSITRGQAASYTVSVTPTGGFTGTVSLAASGLPSNTTSSFTSGSLTFTSTTTQTSTLSVGTSPSTPTGSVTFTVSGTSGKVFGSVNGGLTVNAPVTGSLAMTASPASSTISPGSSAVYGVTITRTNLTAAVTFTLTGALPTGATYAFTPSSTTGNTSSLQVDTKSTTPTGTYSLNLVASGTDVGGVTRTASAAVTLVVSTKGKDFAISGDLVGLLAPGLSRPLNLTLTNPNNQNIAISNLTVTIKSVTKAAHAPAGACSTSDYAVTQYSGPYPLSAPANGSATLSSLGVASSKWPQVRMLDTALNQDGCKGATVTLAYSGSGSGS